MERVYAGYGLSLKLGVAIKTLLPGATAKRFGREVKITDRLLYPYILSECAFGYIITCWS
jgi:hypothetical protein